MKSETLLQQRLREKLETSGLSAWKVSKEATGNPDAIRQIMAGHQPGAERLDKIADYLQTTSDWLLGKDEIPAGAADKLIPYKAYEEPRNVPLVGCALGHDLRLDDDGAIPIEAHLVEMGTTVDYIRRFPRIRSRKTVYGVTFVGDSMVPRYYPGDIGYVDPDQVAAIGDDVVVQLQQRTGEGDAEIVSALIKTLVRRSSSFVELQQYNPATTFRVPSDMVARIHRIIPLKELAVF